MMVMEDGKEFLQSKEWLTLQAATGKETVPFVEEGFSANGILHVLPFGGRYLYVPRGPLCKNFQFSIFNFQKEIQTLIEKGLENQVKWIRIEPETQEILEEIRKIVLYRVVRAPHDMQPRTILKMALALSEEDLLSQMKSKTRYNIRLAEKRGVKVFEAHDEKYQELFLDLVSKTSGRKGITAHPKAYYRQFFQTLPKDICRLFVAEYGGQVIVANLVIFYGDTVIYLHGGSSDHHRDVMAPYLLQWEQIKQAKRLGYQYYDFGGVMAAEQGYPSPNTGDWSGITKFKTGFSPKTLPTIFPGTYDILLDVPGYRRYLLLRKIRSLFDKIKRFFL
jgi:peptidoglycan pentaglycine glycine transferase (the first glycine)